MPIPKHFDLMRPTLELLRDHGEQTRKQLMDHLASQFEVTPTEQAELLPSGRAKTFSNRVGWATTYLGKAGLIERPERAVYKITAPGEQVLATHDGPITLGILKQSDSFVDFVSKTSSSSDSPAISETSSSSSETPEERISAAEKELREALKDELLQRVLENEWLFFERMVLDLLQKMGYGRDLGSTEHKGGSGDGGIDGVVNEDALGLAKIYVQAKCWTSPVSSPDVQKFVGALTKHGANKGVFITTSHFTAEASSYAAFGGAEIALIDGSTLTELMIDYDVGVSLASAHLVKKVDSDYFDESGS